MEDKSTPASDKPAIDFLLRFAAHMKVERDKWKTSKKKREAGFKAGQAYLDNYNLPSDRPSALGNKVKEVATGVYTNLKGRAGKRTKKVDKWIQREHAKLPVDPTPPTIAADSPRQKARSNR